MKLISSLFFLLLMLPSCNGKREVKYISEMNPSYKLLNLFSRKIKQKTDLILRSYGTNCQLLKDYEDKNGILDFSVGYSLPKTKNDEVSLDYARNLIVFLGENLLQEINANLEVRPDLDVYPFTSDLIRITVRFEDENRIELGQGVAYIYFSRGKIKYEGYKIREYTGRYPAIGEHFIIHEESYKEALDIVKKQGGLKYLQETES